MRFQLGKSSGRRGKGWRRKEERRREKEGGKEKERDMRQKEEGKRFRKVWKRGMRQLSRRGNNRQIH